MLYDKPKQLFLTAIVLMAASIALAQTDVFNMPSGDTSLQFVPIGNPNNLADPATGNLYGSVGYDYQISTCEITAGQYTMFLNAVATISTPNPHGVYSSSMATTSIGSQITYDSVAHTYTASLPNLPINWVSWGDAARFCNWLQTGSTETGAYTLNGHTDDTYLMTVTRNPGAQYVIPNENEWYKAAYYDPNKNGLGNGGYWLYPTKSDKDPSNALSTTDADNANFYKGGYTIGGSPYLTDVGYFAGSPSAYGTYDQGGNVWEWSETAFDSSDRLIRGGSWWYSVGDLASTHRDDRNPSWERDGVGFRVEEVPEPGCFTFFFCGALVAWIRQKCRK
jgi:formylglycine-generating enzyme required for sulfatase activity